MEKKTLLPRSLVEQAGKLIYNESQQAWSLIILKKDFLNEFPQLKEKRSSFSYKLVFHRAGEELEKTVKKLRKEENIPILMFLYREEN